MELEYIEEFTGIDPFMDKVKDNIMDDAVYLVSMDLFGTYAAQVTYLGAEGAYSADDTADNPEVILNELKTKADDLGLSIYTGISGNVEEYNVRLHGLHNFLGLGPEDNSEYFEKITKENADTTLEFETEEWEGYTVLLAATLQGNTVTAYMDVIESDETFKQAAVDNGYTVSEGFTGELKEVIDKMSDEELI